MYLVGRYSLHGLGISSNMDEPLIVKMCTGFRNSTKEETGCEHGATNSRWAMTDGELAYRRALAQAFGSGNLMCFFHVKDGTRENFMKRYPGNKDEKDEAWKGVSADIDIAHGASNLSDFKVRCNAMRVKWELEGLAEKTSWDDKVSAQINN